MPKSICSRQYTIKAFAGDLVLIHSSRTPQEELAIDTHRDLDQRVAT